LLLCRGICRCLVVENFPPQDFYFHQFLPAWPSRAPVRSLEACHTQEEIAERENVVKDSVSEICRKMAGLPESLKPAANHLTDFKTQPAINEFLNSIQVIPNGTDAEMYNPSENPELTQDSRICCKEFLETECNKPVANHLTDFDKAMKL